MGLLDSIFRRAPRKRPTAPEIIVRTLAYAEALRKNLADSGMDVPPLGEPAYDCDELSARVYADPWCIESWCCSPNDVSLVRVAFCDERLNVHCAAVRYPGEPLDSMEIIAADALGPDGVVAMSLHAESVRPLPLPDGLDAPVLQVHLEPAPEPLDLSRFGLRERGRLACSTATVDITAGTVRVSEPIRYLGPDDIQYARDAMACVLDAVSQTGVPELDARRPDPRAVLPATGPRDCVPRFHARLLYDPLTPTGRPSKWPVTITAMTDAATIEVSLGQDAAPGKAHVSYWGREPQFDVYLKMIAGTLSASTVTLSTDGRRTTVYRR